MKNLGVKDYLSKRRLLNMQKVFLLTSSLLFWITIASCNSQTSENGLIYPECEPRSVTEPGRLNMRAEARDYGTIPPCKGTLTFYINPNSEVRSIELELNFFNQDDELISVERSTFELSPNSTNMYVNRYSHEPIKGAICWELMIAIRKMNCFSAEGASIDCPDVRIIPSNAFHAITIEDETLNVCSERS